jgi:hypothetical protein
MSDVEWHSVQQNEMLTEFLIHQKSQELPMHSVGLAAGSSEP